MKMIGTESNFVSFSSDTLDWLKLGKKLNFGVYVFVKEQSSGAGPVPSFLAGIEAVLCGKSWEVKEKIFVRYI